MVIVKEIPALNTYLTDARKASKSVGFVPTMGALHDGHISLIDGAKAATSIVVCSVFVNPTQFNDPGDYKKYPSTLPKDIRLLEQAGCDVVFVPSVLEIYPENYLPRHYELGTIESKLEGAARPGHFQGVCQVLDRLLSLVEPDKIFMGQKDYQQCLVVSKLVQLKHFATEVVMSPTQREDNGLAMSSRNLRLTAEQKTEASAIFKMLNYLQSNMAHGDVNQVKQHVKSYLLSHGFNKVDYVEVARATDLETINNFPADKTTIGLIAAFMGEVRLIDNMILN